MNRGQLRTLIQSLGKRTDASDTLCNSFIDLGYEMIWERVRAMEMIADPITLDETDRESEGRYTLPSNYLGAAVVWDSAGRPLDPVSVRELRRITASSAPAQFSIYGYNIEFRGVPDTDSEFTLIPFERPGLMTDDADEPALLTNAPGLFIHSAMHWYRIWSEDPELASAHESAFAELAEHVNSLASQQRGRLVASRVREFRSGSSM